MKRRKNPKFFSTLALALLLFTGLPAHTSANYHLVGWVNLLVPGGGEFLLGNYSLASKQAAFEIATFGIGYSLSARQPFTLDGVPEALPSTDPTLLYKPTLVRICSKRDSAGKCVQFRNVRSTRSEIGYDGTPQDISKPLYADILQEIGLKAHMVDLFEAYRKAAELSHVDLMAAQIDSHSTSELFGAPFKSEYLTDPWVFVPLATTAAVLVASYHSEKGQNRPLPPFNARSTTLYNLTYLGVFPLGSGAPEEMFYRGFVQSEAYALVASPWFSVPASTLLYALSHSPDSQMGAAISGLYLGYLTQRNGGDLRRGIAYHFWSDLLTGIYAIAMIKQAQDQPSYHSPNVSFSFEF